jgi:hypothetical protein
MGGTVCGLALVAMNVGHWYLSATKLTIRPLRNTTLALLGLLVLRALWLIAVCLMAGSELGRFVDPAELTLISIGMIRILFGLIGPLVLAWMTWETVKLESTQSATGILYALLAMVLVGEACATFITLTTSLPA